MLYDCLVHKDTTSLPKTDEFATVMTGYQKYDRLYSSQCRRIVAVPQNQEEYASLLGTRKELCSQSWVHSKQNRFQ